MAIGSQHSRWFAIVAAALLTAAGLGCGIAAAPQPPSLHLPKPVTDLKAERNGNQVLLTWTMPKRTTDNQRLRQRVPVRICIQTVSRACDTVGHLQELPGEPATFTDVLPAVLAQGSMRTITYQVFTLNAQGRAAAPSNDAQTLAGAAPLPVTGLTAQATSQGVLLHWQSVPNLPDGTVFEIQRTLLSSPQSSSTKSAAKNTTKHLRNPQKLQTSISKQKQLPQQTLVVHAGVAANKASDQKEAVDPGGALDTDAQFNATYRYTVARVVEHTVGTKEVRFLGASSQPVTILTKDIFPPATPQRLVAIVVSAAMNGGTLAVDLSWSANRESDFAHYRVYRHDVESSVTPILISPTPGSPPSAALVTPTYHDVSIEAGHRYAYSVRAVDTSGNESQPSQEVMVDIPANGSNN